MKPDEQLQTNVMAELEYAQEINPARIGVTATREVVTLTGTVDTYMQKLLAAEATERVSGVRGVANEIEVKPTAAHHLPDANIAQAALNVLGWSWIVALKAVHVWVEDGAHPGGGGDLGLPAAGGPRRGGPADRGQGREQPDRPQTRCQAQ